MINVSVAYARADLQIEIPLVVEESCTVALAIQRSGVLKQFPELELSKLMVGIHSQRAKLDNLLCEGARVEIYRPLLQDPKQARIKRAKMQS